MNSKIKNYLGIFNMLLLYALTILTIIAIITSLSVGIIYLITHLL